MSFNEILVKGGLGNQLFCLFYAYRLLLQNNDVSLNLINYAISNRNDRKFVLERLFPDLRNKFFINNSNKSYILLMYSKIVEKFFIKSKFDRLPGDKTFSIPYWPNYYIHSGYFQKITNSELDEISLNLLRKQISPYLDKCKNNFLAIHIRRGDYLDKKHEIHGLISENYLLEESKKQISKEDFDGITIFTDSPKLVDLNIFNSIYSSILNNL